MYQFKSTHRTSYLINSNPFEIKRILKNKIEWASIKQLNFEMDSCSWKPELNSVRARVCRIVFGSGRVREIEEGVKGK